MTLAPSPLPITISTVFLALVAYRSTTRVWDAHADKTIRHKIGMIRGDMMPKLVMNSDSKNPEIKLRKVG